MKSVWPVAQAVDRIVVQFLVGLVKLYQWTLSPLIGRQCRFQPTCSHYMIESLHKYGSLRGTAKGIARICRCHPFHPGGFDPP